MKPFFLYFLLVISLLTFTTCKSDDDQKNIVEETQNHPIVGKWSLLEVTGGFSPTANFEVGQIIWNIKADGTMNVTISDGVVPAQNDRFTDEYLGLNYVYSFNEEQTEITFVSNGYPYHPQKMVYIISLNKLYLDAGVASDGVGRDFVRIQ